MGWSFMGCCCAAGDIYDFFGPPHGHTNENSSTESIAGFLVTRVASLCDLTQRESQSSSSGLWEVDVTDFGSSHNTIWYSKAQHFANDKSHIVYYFSSEDSVSWFGTDDTVWHIHKVLVPFNGTPTLLAEYSFDWDSVLRLSTGAGAGPYIFVLDALNDRVITRREPSSSVSLGAGSPVFRLSDESYSPPVNQFTGSQPVNPVQPRLASVSLTDGSYTSLHNSVFDGLGGGFTNNKARENALAADFLPYYVAIHDPSIGVASKYELTYTPGSFGIPPFGTHPTLDSWTQTVSVGKITYSGTNTTLSPDVTVYSNSGVNLVAGGSSSLSQYEVPHARCDFLESFEGKHLGIFFHSIVRMNARSGPTGITAQGLSNNDSGGPGASWDITLAASNTYPVRADILMPSGNMWTGVTTQTLTGAGTYRWDASDFFVPVCGRLALDENGQPNGKYFLLTANWFGSLVGDVTVCRLHYMDEDTILWSHDFSDFTTDPRLAPDLTVTDRFCYVHLHDADDPDPETNQHSYAFDYDGNRYRLYLETGAEDTPFPSLRTFDNRTYHGTWFEPDPKPISLGSRYFESWASVKYSDNLSPTREIMGRYS